MLTSTRKSLPLPAATDPASTTTSTGRGTTTSGVVRDSISSISTIADFFTDFDKNEVITGSWEFQQGILADKGSVVMAQNNTGGARVAGDVVMLDPANDSAFILPNQNSVDASKVLVVAEAIASAAIGRVTLLGLTRVKVAGGTTRGQYLATANASVSATGSAVITPGSFAYSLSNPDGASTVLAAVHAGGAGGGLEVAEVDAAPDVIGTRKLVFPNGSLTDQGAQVVAVSFGSSILRREQYVGVSGTTQVLTLVPDTVLSVTKNGIEQKLGTDFTVVGATITFSTALSTDNIVVIYIQTNSFNPSSAPYIQEFDPAAAATIVNIANVPTTIMFVLRNGVAQSQTKGDWSWGAGTTVVTFSDPFVTGDHVIIGYAQNFGGGNAASVNGLPAVPASAPAANSLVATDANGRLPASTMPTTTSYREEFQPANAATTVVLSQAPGAVLYVARDGVVQSIADGHYTLAGSTLTFTDAFDGVSRVVVGYILGTNIGAANTVGGFSASSDAVATPGTLVATNAVSGKLPPSILSPLVNQLVNGGLENWQRGNGPFTANGVFTADRWVISLVGTDTLSVSRNTASADTGSQVAAACTFVLGTGAGGTGLYQYDRISEGYGLRGRQISLSVRVLTTVANAVRVGLATDGAAPATAYSAFHSGDGAYHTLTVTLTVPADATNVQTTTFFAASCTAYIDNAMLAISTAPVDYQPLTPADELARCLRYYELQGTSSALGAGYCDTTSTAQISFRCLVQKTIIPTVTISGPTNFGVSSSGISPACTSVSVGAIDVRGSPLVGTTAAVLTLGRGAILYVSAGGSVAVEANP